MKVNMVQMKCNCLLVFQHHLRKNQTAGTGLMAKKTGVLGVPSYTRTHVHTPQSRLLQRTNFTLSGFKTKSTDNVQNLQGIIQAVKHHGTGRHKTTQSGGGGQRETRELKTIDSASKHRYNCTNDASRRKIFATTKVHNKMVTQ